MRDMDKKRAYDKKRVTEKRANERKAALKDPTLHEKTAPLDYHLGGVSTYVDADGNKRGQWIKTRKDLPDPTAFIEAFRDAVATLPARTAISAPSTLPHCSELMCSYPMGDPHLGMLAWGKETGTDFDLDIASEGLVEAFDSLVALAPASDTALIVNLSDYFHSDSSAGTTTKGTRVDADSRRGKVLRVGLRTLVRCVDKVLTKHRKAYVKSGRGNHDADSSTWLTLCLEAYYRNNPRVEIDASPNPFQWHEFGKNLIGITHGDTVKPDKLPGIMAEDMRQAWGRTIHRYWLTGHVHHQRVFEFPGCTVESFNTLAPRDAWHHSQGYRSRRGMVCDVFHKEEGRIMRFEDWKRNK